MRHALVAQLDRVTGYEPVGRGFESLPARQIKANRFYGSPLFFCSNPEGTRTRASSSKQASYRLFRLLFFLNQAGSALTALFLLFPKVLPAQIFWVPTMRSTRVFGRTVRGTVRYRVRALPARHVVADFISFAISFATFFIKPYFCTRFAVRLSMESTKISEWHFVTIRRFFMQKPFHQNTAYFSGPGAQILSARCCKCRPPPFHPA